MATDPPHPLEPAEESEKQSSRVQLWLVVLAVLVLGGVVELIIYGYLERPGWIGSSGKQFWDYLELLIVPAALALGVYWLNRRQAEREQQADRLQQQRQQEADRFQHQLQLEHNQMQQNRELEVVMQQAQDAALRAYLDQMSQLLTDKEQPLHEAERGDSLSTVARARTLTVLPTLNANRKRSVLQFLYEAGLIDKEHPIVDLTGAELRGIDLHGANLSEADLSGADLSGADLSGADGWTEEQLRAAFTLEGATMPDGQTLRGGETPHGPTFEDWLKSKSSGEGGENEQP